MSFKKWGELLTDLSKKTEDGAALKEFREYREALFKQFTSNQPFLKTFDQFRCIQDARLSIAVTNVEIKTDKETCLFGGKPSEGNSLYFVQFTSLVERSPTLIGTHPNITLTPFYCVSRLFLFYLYGIHFLSRAETLLYSACTETERALAIIQKLLWCIQSLKIICSQNGQHRSTSVSASSSAASL